jgi:hypothetical protein
LAVSWCFGYQRRISVLAVITWCFGCHSRVSDWLHGLDHTAGCHQVVNHVLTQNNNVSVKSASPLPAGAMPLSLLDTPAAGWTHLWSDALNHLNDPAGVAETVGAAQAETNPFFIACNYPGFNP